MLGTIKITYNGEKHTLRFNNYSRFYMSEKFGDDANSVGEALVGQGVPFIIKNIIEAGLVGWAEQTGKEISMSTNQISEYFADAPDEEINMVYTEWEKWFLAKVSGDKKQKKKKLFWIDQKLEKDKFMLTVSTQGLLNNLVNQANTTKNSYDAIATTR